MKKLKVILGIVLCLALCFCFTLGLASASADEIPTEEVSEELTIDGLKEELKSYIDKNVEDENLKSIIYLVLFGGVGTALIGVYIKYRKFKHNTLEEVAKTMHNDLTEFFTEKFDNLSAEKIQPIVECIDKVDGALETVMKVLVLMQDKTPEGKVALLEFLGAKTENQAIKESVAEVKGNIEQEQKTAQEVNSKVKEQYNEIVF